MNKLRCSHCNLSGYWNKERTNVHNIACANGGERAYRRLLNPPAPPKVMFFAKPVKKARRISATHIQLPLGDL
jgi:hypothetical protein